MKTKLIISLLIWFVISAFLFNSSDRTNINGNNQNPTVFSGDKLFIIGSVANGSYNDYSGFLEANLNTWHRYSTYEKDQTNHYLYPIGWNSLDIISNPINVYKQSILDKMDINASYNLYTYLMRPKIEYLCYGQHSVYQCEPLAEDPDNNATDWFYSYYDHETGAPVQDGGRTVMYCSVNNDNHNEGYVVKNLKSNRELCNRVVTNLTQDNMYDWYILPAIKVPQDIGDETRVCRIEIIGWNGNTVSTMELKGKNFKVQNYYSGDYQEEFNFNTGSYLPFKITAEEAENFNPDEQGWWKIELDCQFDIRVKWYKETDMWIDYVKVENKMAYDLLKGGHDDWIQEEAEAFGIYTQGKPYKFYVEEVEYNNLPCISYVNSKLSSYGQSVLCVPYLNIPPMNNRWIDFKTPKKASVYSNTGLTEIFSSYYPLNAHKFSIHNFGKPSYVPNTFEGYSYDMTQGKLGYPVPPAEYEQNLESLLDDTRLFDLKTSQELSKSSGKPFNFMVQAHSWLNPAELNNEDEIYSLREPTNEEIEMMVGVGLTYGAKGIIYFSYNSGGDYNSHNGKYSYTKGLLEYDTPNITKRTLNVYGENKWAKVVEINQKLKHWEQYLINFNDQNTKSYKYHIAAERNDLTQNTFIKELKTYPNGDPANCPQTDFDYNIPDPENSTFLQTGIFKNTSEPYSIYFMLVNKRCSPGRNACSGTRKIKSTIFSDVFFNHFNNWEIINLQDNSIIATFNKKQANNIDFGWFNPGEGKLYKVAPVMVEGGTFVCDEVVNGLTFDCKAQVYTGTHNLDINGATIYFLDQSQ
ncbi:MAG: hypothetical protein PHN88_16310, partial [Ignavibacteria bacterium]|nr:hypothetical protein [Ignavibacteria bacterium]